MSPVMADVAKRAGVSKSTVSLVLNSKPGVSAEVRAAVSKAANELGYSLPQRQDYERSLQNRTAAIVNYALAGPGIHTAVTSAVPATALDSYMVGIRERFLMENVNWVLVATYHEGGDESLGFRFLGGGGLSSDGLIVMGANAGQSSPLIERALEAHIPVVVISRNWPEVCISSVGQDHHQQARIALDHLVSLGHRTIAFVSLERFQSNDWFQWRLDCYRTAMIDLYGHVDEELIVVGGDGDEVVRSLMTRRPDVTAIFATNDPSAVQVMAGLVRAGFRVPQDVSIIGLDGRTQTPEGYPDLTSVGYPQEKVGYLAADLLLKHIEDDELLCANVLVSSYLVDGASCAAPRV